MYKKIHINILTPVGAYGLKINSHMWNNTIHHWVFNNVNMRIRLVISTLLKKKVIKSPPCFHLEAYTTIWGLMIKISNPIFFHDDYHV
jgi:hypothetical protein